MFFRIFVNPSLLFIRFFRGNRIAKNGSFSGLFDGDETREHGIGRKTGPLLSGTAYCISSCSMILLNKVVLSGYNFDAGVSLMFYQVCHSFLSHRRLKKKYRVCQIEQSLEPMIFFFLILSIFTL